MEKTTRNILIFVGMMALLCAGMIGYAVYKVYSFFSQIELAHEMPDEIREARILKGVNLLHKTEMFKVNAQGLLKTISDVANTKDEREVQKTIRSGTARENSSFSDIKIVGDEIVAVGSFGGFVFDLNGKLKREISFEPSEEKIKIGRYEQTYDQPDLGNLKIAELEKNVLGFFSYGSMQGFTVFDKNGKQIWSFGKEQIDLSIMWQDGKERDKSFQNKKYVIEAAVGDLDNDGFAEYIVAVQNDGIRAFNHNGIEQWFQPDKFPSGSLQIADIDGNGKKVLLQIGIKSRIRDANGHIIRELKCFEPNGLIAIDENRNKKKSIVVCNIQENRLECVDENANVVMDGDAPLSAIPKKNPKKVTVPFHPELTYVDDCERAAFPKAVWVAFRKDQTKYLAVVHSFIVLPRSHFYLYDIKGNLVYHEILPEGAKTIAVIPAANEDQEIIIGGKSTIWRYALN